MTASLWCVSCRAEHDGDQQRCAFCGGHLDGAYPSNGVPMVLFDVADLDAPELDALCVALDAAGVPHSVSSSSTLLAAPDEFASQVDQVAESAPWAQPAAGAVPPVEAAPTWWVPADQANGPSAPDEQWGMGTA